MAFSRRQDVTIVIFETGEYYEIPDMLVFGCCAESVLTGKDPLEHYCKDWKKDMIKILIPGQGELALKHLVLDYNGTIALDGNLCPDVAEKLAALAPHLDIHVITADTHGTVKAKIAGLNCTLALIGPDLQDRAKLDYITGLGPQHCACIGNGRNDAAMLKAAALGIAVIGPEGAAGAAVTAADVVVTGIADALDLLLTPLRLPATLRN